MSNSDLVARAMQLIRDIHGNTTVSREQTIKDLEELGSAIDGMLEALRSDAA